MIKTILFDFDGTLFDTGEGILRSVQYALEGFGIHETDTARLRKFVGPPLLDSFSELYAMTPEPAQAAGKTVLLVDDVITTGATLDECAKMLKLAGAAEVYAVTAAGTVPHERNGSADDLQNSSDGV